MNRNRALWIVAIVGLALGVTVYATNIYETTDGPMPIADNSGALGDCQTINVPDSIVITDVEVEITAAHSWVSDLTFEVTSPASTSLTIINRSGRNGTGAGNNVDLVDTTPVRYSDAAPSGLSAETLGDNCTGAAIIDGSAGCEDNYTPDPDATDTPVAGTGTDFGDFDGENAQGVWTLCVADSAGGDTGTLTSWRLGINKPIPVELLSFSID
ncbi:MAG: proprotein convertase P-domain-containing protein [Acidobacteriota bacterium]